jgi:hypothetical protein
MRDGGRIVGGLVIVATIVLGPLWLGSARGVKTAELAKPTGGDRCVAPREEMRRNHPALLASWRERVVRQGDRVHDLGNGQQVRISLTGTCLGCHGKAADFCDKCHAQAAVTLSCFGCHDQAKN